MTGRGRAGLAVVLWVLTALGLASSHRSVGYVRDEGIYFEASRRQAAWLARVAGSPRRATHAPSRDAVFAFNHEHPPLMKLAAAASAAVFAKPPAVARGNADSGGVWPILSEGAAMRLPAQVLAGLAVALLFWVGSARRHVWAGLLAAGWFIALPRVWFHAGLHAFDVPIAVAVLAVVLAWQAAQRDWRWGVAVGPILGIAIAIKHNALFVGPLLLGHHAIVLAASRLRHRVPLSWGRVFPLPVWSIALLAPACAWTLWPWLWHQPWPRLLAYLEFHRHHSWYNMEFLGVNYNQPPMPTSYPWVMTLATVPLVLLVLASIGLVLGVRGDLRPSPGDDALRPFFAPLGATAPAYEGVLWLMFALFPIVLISAPQTPIFGGTKHWLTAYPFFALAAARAWVHLWRNLETRHGAWLEPLALATVLAPAVIASIDAHPYGASQYTPVVGGPRGAARLGLNRGYWGHAVRGLLPALPARGRIYVGDIHELARLQYEREGDWPTGLRSAAIGQANGGLIFHERHMATYEFQLWNRLQTTRPSAVLSLDDVPLTDLYLPEP